MMQHLFAISPFDKTTFLRFYVTFYLKEGLN